jgi:hypothetical protein
VDRRRPRRRRTDDAGLKPPNSKLPWTKPVLVTRSLDDTEACMHGNADGDSLS